MRTKVLIVVLTFFNTGFSQNLIPNGSFNDVNICTEYSAPCAPSAWKAASHISYQYLSSDSINKFVGITIYNTSTENVRQYIQGQLLCPLIKDKIYKFSVKLKPDNVVVESLGVLFTDSALFFDKDLLIKRKPSFLINLKKIPLQIMRRRDWVKVEAEYKANGNEKYIIIGSFQSDAQQKKTFLSPPKPYTDYFYDIDDVCFYPKDSIPLCADYETTRAELYSLKKRHTLHKRNIFPPVIEDDTEIKNKIDTIRLSVFLFEFDSAIFDPFQKVKLDSLLGKISKEDIEIVDILGYTDSIGTDDYNLGLSIRRAEAIKQVFKEFGYPDKKTNIKGFGESNPVDSNSEPKGRKKNRRAELVLKYKQKNPISNTQKTKTTHDPLIKNKP